MRKDLPAPIASLSFKKPAFSLRVHIEVFDTLAVQPELKSKVNNIIQHLIAHGMKKGAKGCKSPENKGWLRQPLSGNNKSHYYLWWAPYGNEPAKGIDLSEGDIIIRAIRHHDDNTDLKAGGQVDYMPIYQKDLEDEAYIGRAWSKKQLSFIEGSEPVRSLLGTPGSGKTTALLKAIESRAPHNILYLTWSQKLASDAEKRLTSFAPLGSEIRSIHYHNFLERVCQKSIASLRLSECQAEFYKAISRLSPSQMGPWNGKVEQLFAEVRAYLLGRLIPDEEGKLCYNSVFLSTDDAYVMLRGTHGYLGNEAAGAVPRIVNTIPVTTRNKLFPDLCACHRAINKIRKREVTDEMKKYERIVVDEVQDLTLLELAVIAELCKLIAETKGAFPILLVAGDDGQTVRPSGFDWGVYHDYIAQSVGNPKRYQLTEGYRCPLKIEEVISRMSEQYERLEKGNRPTKQYKIDEALESECQLLHAVLESPDEAECLLDTLAGLLNIGVIVPCGKRPKWMSENVFESLLTPSLSKGLEYQHVVLVDPGLLLKNLDSVYHGSGAYQVEKLSLRTAIDQFRVSLSRATETLTFLDVVADPDMLQLSMQLLGKHEVVTAEQLVKRLTDESMTVDEHISLAVTRARAHVDERPGLAWRYIVQTVEFCLNTGDLAVPASDYIVKHAKLDVLDMCAALFLDPFCDSNRATEVYEIAVSLSHVLGCSRQERAFRLYYEWSQGSLASLNMLLNMLVELQGSGRWLVDSMAGKLQRVLEDIERSARSADSARYFSGDVEGWFKLFGSDQTLAGKVLRLRLAAFETLLSAKAFSEAEELLPMLELRTKRYHARLREAQGLYDEAAKLYQQDNSPKDALRCWRKAGNIEKALRIAVAGSPEWRDINWLQKYAEQFGSMPEGLLDRLTPAELGTLVQLSSRICERQGKT